MAYSYIEYTGTGTTTTFSIPFPYMEQADVKVYVNGVATAFTFTSSSTVSVSPAPASGTLVRIARETNRDNRVVDFQDGSILSEKDLDKSADQVFFVVQEAYDNINDQMHTGADAQWDAQNKKLTNLADPVNAQDAATKAWVDTSTAASATAAKTSETNAAASASAAKTSQDAAKVSQDAAKTSETNAATSATNASTSASNAAGSATSAKTEADSIKGVGIATTAALNTSWNTITKTGVYTNGTTVVGEAPAANAYLTVYHAEGINDHASQICVRAGNDQMWTRRKSAGTWSTWVEVKHTGNPYPVYQGQLADAAANTALPYSPALTTTVTRGGFVLSNTNTTVTVPVAGMYKIYAQQLVQANANGGYYMGIRQNLTTTLVHAYIPPNVGQVDAVASCIANLAANDTIGVHYSGTGPLADSWGGAHSSFYLEFIG